MKTKLGLEMTWGFIYKHRNGRVGSFQGLGGKNQSQASLLVWPMAVSSPLCLQMVFLLCVSVSKTISTVCI